MVMVTDKEDTVDLYDNNDSDVDDSDDVDDVGADDTDFDVGDVELMISFSPALSIVHSLNSCDCSCDGGGSWS